MSLDTSIIELLQNASLDPSASAQDRELAERFLEYHRRNEHLEALYNTTSMVELLHFGLGSTGIFLGILMNLRSISGPMTAITILSIFGSTFLEERKVNDIEELSFQPATAPHAESTLDQNNHSVQSVIATTATPIVAAAHATPLTLDDNQIVDMQQTLEQTRRLVDTPEVRRLEELGLAQYMAENTVQQPARGAKYLLDAGMWGAKQIFDSASTLLSEATHPHYS